MNLRGGLPGILRELRAEIKRFGRFDSRERNRLYRFFFAVASTVFIFKSVWRV